LRSVMHFCGPGGKSTDGGTWRFYGKGASPRCPNVGRKADARRSNVEPRIRFSPFQRLPSVSSQQPGHYYQQLRFPGLCVVSILLPVSLSLSISMWLLGTAIESWARILQFAPGTAATTEFADRPADFTFEY
jgi:hypothetical protein